MERYRYIPAEVVGGYWTLRGQFAEPELRLTKEEAAKVPVPFYVYDLEPDSEVGVFTEDIDEFTNVIPLPDSFDELDIDQDFRKDLRRVEKKNAELRLAQGTKDELVYASKWFLELCPDETEDDFRIRVEDWGRNCRLVSAFLGDELIAVHIAWDKDDTVHYCGCWWNRAYRNMSPAVFLLKKDIEKAIADGKKFYDLGIGDEKYKQEWRPKHTPTKYYAKMSKEVAEELEIPKFDEV
jgi:hypothetical protein